jgi:hypothetical protein
MHIARMHKQMLRSKLACFNVAVLKAATNTTSESNTAAADHANGFSTISPPSTATIASPRRQHH